MEASTQVILSGCITFGVPLILAIRELIVVRRPPRGGWNGDGPPPPAPIVPPPDASPQRYNPLQPLPDCLIPRPYAEPARTRIPELV